MSNVIRRLMDKAHLMDRMMTHLQVRDAIAEQPHGAEILRQAVVRCASCAHGEECRVWLDTASQAASAPSFCRNQDLFDQLSGLTDKPAA